jgi:hypothetical protein
MASQQAKTWMLLVYKVPREPTSARAAVWRRLKRLGAVLLHDAVWVLPATDWTHEQFQWLAVEITELGGEALLWESRLLLDGQEVLTAVEQEPADLVALSRQYQQVKLQDYFHSELGKQVRTRLLSARGGHDT